MREGISNIRAVTENGEVIVSKGFTKDYIVFSRSLTRIRNLANFAEVDTSTICFSDKYGVHYFKTKNIKALLEMYKTFYGLIDKII